MHKRILEFLEKKKAIYWKLFGLRANHSTDHAILGIIDLMWHLWCNQRLVHLLSNQLSAVK